MSETIYLDLDRCILPRVRGQSVHGNDLHHKGIGSDGILRTQKPINCKIARLQRMLRWCLRRLFDSFFLSFFLWLHLHWANDGAGQGNAVVGLGADNAREKLVEVENGVDEGNVVGHHNWGHLLAGRFPNATNPVKPATTSKNPLWASLVFPKTLGPNPIVFFFLAKSFCEEDKYV